MRSLISLFSLGKGPAVRASRILSPLALPLALSFTGCAGGEPEPEPEDDLPYDCSEGFCVLTGTITKDLTLTADKEWVLRGGVFIGNDADETVLTIEPGTIVYGESSTKGFLTITRASKLVAEGTADAPIVFTSSKEEGQRARGDWGGLIINGRAPVNGCNEAPCESFGEGGTGYYGGSNDADSSGVLKFVRVEFAGNLISPDNELNGIAFQGVGSGTVVDTIQVHMAADDCIEFFGGTVSVKRVLCTGIADDNLDFTDGWVGNLQFLVAQQFDDAGDNGIEADNNAENNASLPRSSPTISNITLLGAPGSSFADTGILLREGTGAFIANAIVAGFGEGCLDVDHAETFANGTDGQGGLSGNLVIEHSIFDCTPLVVDDEDDVFAMTDFIQTMNEGNTVGDPTLTAPFEAGEADYRPAGGSPALQGARIPSDAFFEIVTFKGGVDPNNDWTAGWTIRARN
jgi:hypothetical protein